MPILVIALLSDATQSPEGSSPGTAVVILGGAVVLAVTGGLLIWARIAQRRYFREFERIYEVEVHDPFVLKMTWSDVFQRRSNYWTTILDDPELPELRALRGQMLKRVGLAAVTLIVGLTIVVQVGKLVGFT
jgi:hypothetical protein